MKTRLRKYSWGLSLARAAGPRAASQLGTTALLALALAGGCQRAPTPAPVEAAQEGFGDGDLTAGEAHGKRVFGQRCATCHGPEGRGDGQNAFNLQPPPPVFQESLVELSVEDRRAVIEGGTAALDRSALCPPWGRSLRIEEVDALLAYMAVMERLSPQDEEPTSGRRRWRRP
jgi:mono/diheme cytochrome c family protein